MLTEKKKVFFKWWLVVVVVYLVFAGVVVRFYGAGFLMPANDDSAHHIKLAENLIKYRTFSLDGLYSDEEPTLPLKPTNFLTPGYAFWLALIYLIFKSFVPAIFIGAAVFAFAIPITYFLAEEITENKKIAFWSAALFLIEPLSIYHSGLLFTEQIFVPLFLAGAFWFIKYLKNGSFNYLSAALVTFSAATLVRPIIFYILPALVLTVIFKELKVSLKRAAAIGLMSLILTYSVAGVWVARNKIVLDTWQISGNQGAILAAHYELVAKSLKMSSFGIPPFNYELNNFSTQYNNNLGEAALRELSKHKWTYIKIKFGYLPVFFLSNGYDNLFSRLSGRFGLSESNKLRNDMAIVLLNGRFGEFFELVNRAGFKIIILSAGIIFWAGAALMALAGVWRLWRVQKISVAAILALMLYFAFVSSPWVVARYRLPVNPFIFIFAVSGFYFLRDRIKQWI